MSDNTSPDLAPWPDSLGQPIRHGDRLSHPDGTEFVAVRLSGFDNDGDAWRAIYDDASVSRLCLRIGDKGRAFLVAQAAPAPLTDAARRVVREALDAVEVHPCDVNDDAVRAKGLYGPMADLYAALAAPGVPPQPTSGVQEVPPDAEKLCWALRPMVRIVPAGAGECWVRFKVASQEFTVGNQPMPEDGAAHFAGLFVFALASAFRTLPAGVPQPYAPLTADEVRHLSAMVFGAPAAADWIEHVGEPMVRQLEALLASGERPRDPAALTDAEKADCGLLSELDGDTPGVALPRVTDAEVTQALERHCLRTDSAEARKDMRKALEGFLADRAAGVLASPNDQPKE